MRHRAVRAVPASALVLAVGIAVGGCTTVGAVSGGSASSATSSATASGAARTSALADGPPVPGSACAAALQAKQTLEARQGKDQSSESAIDQDFTTFASALSAAAQQEQNPAAAKAMTALATGVERLRSGG